MKKTEWENQNTVKSENQVSSCVKMSGDENGSPRVLILGNSITWHSPLAEIGWEGDWGMAASSRENDYAHIVMAEILNKYPNAAFCITQGASWEREYKDFDFDSLYSAAKDFNPDLIICLLTDNMIVEDFDKDLFVKNMGDFHTYLSGNNKNTKIVITSSFGSNDVKDEGIKAYAEAVDAKYIYIGDLNKDDVNLAKGKFWHEGVACHPGDVGMKVIAERIIQAVKEYGII